MGIRLATTAFVIAAASSASGQGVFKFRLTPGDKLQYQSQFEYRVETKAEGATQISTSKLGQLREWHVVGVDKLGIAVTDDEIREQLREQGEEDKDIEEFIDAGGADRVRNDLRMKKAVDRIAAEVKPIAPELAEAREAIWTPDKENPPTETKLWTPDQPPPDQQHSEGARS